MGVGLGVAVGGTRVGVEVGVLVGVLVGGKRTGLGVMTVSERAEAGYCSGLQADNQANPLTQSIRRKRTCRVTASLAIIPPDGWRVSRPCVRNAPTCGPLGQSYTQLLFFTTGGEDDIKLMRDFVKGSAAL